MKWATACGVWCQDPVGGGYNHRDSAVSALYQLLCVPAATPMGVYEGGGYHHRDSAVNALYQLPCVLAATPMDMGVYEGNTLGGPLLAM